MQAIVLTIALRPEGERHRAGVYRGCAVTSTEAALVESVRDDPRKAIDAALTLARVDIADEVLRAYQTPSSVRLDLALDPAAVAAPPAS
jgi:hypothetical protein